MPGHHDTTLGALGCPSRLPGPTGQGSLENPSLMVWGCEYDLLYSMQCLKSLGSRPRPYRAWPVAGRMPGLILACCPSELILTPGLGGQGHSKRLEESQSWGISSANEVSQTPLRLKNHIHHTSPNPHLPRFGGRLVKGAG